MGDRVVTSLAGEEVLVVDDQDFATLAGFNPGSREFALNMQMTKFRLATLRALWRHGRIVDKSGLATSQLAERVRRLDDVGEFGITPVLAAPLMRYCVERVTKGKRTLSIQLVVLPETWLGQVDGSLRDASFVGTAQLSINDAGDRVHPAPVAVPEPESPFPLPPVPVVDTRHDVEHSVADAVATALLARVVEIMSTGNGNAVAMKNAQLATDVADLTRRLGEQVGYVERLRRDLRQAQDELIATKSERDGLRQRAQAAEHNLKIATGADAQRIIDAEVHRQVDRIMRQAPGSDKAAS